MQGVLQRYELNKKWYYLWGVTCFFAYIYIRPLIRRGIGSASRHALPAANQCKISVGYQA